MSVALTITIDDVARAITFALAVGVIVVCALIVRRDRQSWRVVVPVMFWAVSVGAWAMVAMFAVPRPIQLINWWSRLNLWYAAIVIMLLLALHYAMRKPDGGS